MVIRHDQPHSNMITPLIQKAFLLLLPGCILLSSCRPSGRDNADAVMYNKCALQLQETASAIAIVEAELQDARIEPDGVAIVRKLHEKYGQEYLRACNSKTFRLQVLGDPEIWKHKTNHLADIALYNPVAVYDARTGKNVFMGISFGRDLLKLAKVPAWKAK